MAVFLCISACHLERGKGEKPIGFIATFILSIGGRFEGVVSFLIILSSAVLICTTIGRHGVFLLSLLPLYVLAKIVTFLCQNESLKVSHSQLLCC